MAFRKQQQQQQHNIKQCEDKDKENKKNQRRWKNLRKMYFLLLAYCAKAMSY